MFGWLTKILSIFYWAAKSIFFVLQLNSFESKNRKRKTASVFLSKSSEFFFSFQYWVLSSSYATVQDKDGQSME
jgi:hypothetical protein